jgi:hypothetical protein
MDDPLKSDVEVHCAGSAAKSNCIRARFVIIRHFVTRRNALNGFARLRPDLNMAAGGKLEETFTASEKRAVDFRRTASTVCPALRVHSSKSALIGTPRALAIFTSVRTDGFRRPVSRSAK